MTEVTEEQVRNALAGVTAPGVDKDLVALGLVSGVVIRDGNVGFAIEITPEQAQAFEPVRKTAEKTVAALPGVLSVTAVLTAERAQGQQQPPPQRAAARRASRLRCGSQQARACRRVARCSA